MGAPIIVKGSNDLWVTNGIKDLFCKIVVDVAKGEGHDISEVYEVAAGIAGTYGVSGLGIDVDEFLSYFDGLDGFIVHLEQCKAKIPEIIADAGFQALMINIFSWVQYLLSGGEMENEINYYIHPPPQSPKF